MPPTVIKVTGKATGNANAAPQARAQAEVQAKAKAKGINTKKALYIMVDKPCSTMTKAARVLPRAGQR